MNQRSRNCRSHSTMPLCQFVERRNGIRIAQYDGYLASFLAQRSLTLGAGLGLGHGLGLRGIKAANSVCATLRDFTTRPASERLSVDAHVERAIRLLGDRDRSANGELLGEFLAEHVHLRGESIPPMCESYAVTSDVSTPMEAI